MKCPCCGKDMVMDGHRKIDMFMCYECGYIEGRIINETYSPKAAANYGHRHGLSVRKAVALFTSILH